MSTTNGASATTDVPSDFVGETGPGAQINLYLPQPGQHVGRRILKVEGLQPGAFRPDAVDYGTAWSEYLGLAKSGDRWQISSPSRFRSRWLGRYGSKSGVNRRLLTEVAGRFDDWVGISPSQQPQARLHVEGENEDQSNIPDVDVDTNSGTGTDPAGDQDTVDDITDRLVNATQILDDGIVNIGDVTWGGTVTETEVDLEQPPDPAFFIIQVIGITSDLGDYGLGPTAKTFSLLPGEQYKFSSRTWRSSTEKASLATSIIDSYDEQSAERFSETVMGETTDQATQSKSENWFVEAEAKASFGIGSVGVSGGGGGEYTSSTEEFSKSMDEAIQEHTAEASSHRENTVTSTSETTVSTEEEETVERVVTNINQSRILNCVFREATQAYRVRTHLKSVRVAYSNGNAESWREVPISELRSLVSEFVRKPQIDRVCSEILATIAITKNVDEEPVPVLERVRVLKCGTEFKVTPARPNDNCVYDPPTDDVYYRFRRGPLAQPADEERPIEGVVLSDQTVMLSTDSLVVEPLLSQGAALDTYSEELQLESIRTQKLANDQAELALELVRSGTADQVALYKEVFGECCESGDIDIDITSDALRSASRVGHG